jgi:hypothetical protein
MKSSVKAGSLLDPPDEGIDSSEEDLDAVPFAGDVRRGAAFLEAVFFAVADFAMIIVLLFSNFKKYHAC